MWGRRLSSALQMRWCFATTLLWGTAGVCWLQSAMSPRRRLCPVWMLAEREEDGWCCSLPTKDGTWWRGTVLPDTVPRRSGWTARRVGPGARVPDPPFAITLCWGMQTRRTKAVEPRDCSFAEVRRCRRTRVGRCGTTTYFSTYGSGVVRCRCRRGRAAIRRIRSL